MMSFWWYARQSTEERKIVWRDYILSYFDWKTEFLEREHNSEERVDDFIGDRQITSPLFCWSLCLDEQAEIE